LSPPTLALRSSSGFALVIEVQPRNAIDATPSAMTARVLKHIIAKKIPGGASYLEFAPTIYRT
jgi:hypothetical protein